MRNTKLNKITTAGLAAALFLPLAHAAEPPALPLRVCVFNLAGVPEGVLKPARKLATATFRAAGVELQWVDSHMRDCSEQSTLYLKILDHAIPEHLTLKDTAFGASFFSKGENFARFAYIFYNRVNDFAHDERVSRSNLLGRVFAHEMGHLLLGADSHTRNGLMTAVWNRRMLENSYVGQTRFSREQCARIRDEVLLRIQSVRANTQPIFVRVLNYANAPDNFVHQATTYARNALLREGVDSEWILHSTKECGRDCNQCRRTRGRFVLTMRVVPDAMALGWKDRPNHLGFSLIPPEGSFGNIGGVYYARVRDLAALYGTGPGLVLGIVMAHEAGHLLLGADSHSPDGIMSDPLTLQHIKVAAQGNLRFTPQEAVALREAAGERRREVELAVATRREPVGE